MATVWILLILVSCTAAFECDRHAKVCETSLNIHFELPMTTEDGPVYSYNGDLYHYNVTDPNNAIPVDKENVITADGWEKPYRLIIAANGSLPGPPIILYEGQTVIIHVNNNLQSESVTIHWHGVEMKDNPWMDGPAYITQCPISPGQSFTYKFVAKPAGTFWYHSHIGHQRLNGLFGAFIIRENLPKLMDEHIMQIFEWNHNYGSDTDDMMEELGSVYKDRKRLLPSMQLDNVEFTTYDTHAGLINGRGRFWDSPTSNNGAPLETFNVVAGKSYRFRVIATGALFPWRISVDQHNLTMVASDGFELVPVEAESFIISPGERYDFILNANQAISNYWIRGETLDRRFTKRAEAILHYNGSSFSEPTSTKTKCTFTQKCTVVNCPFPFYPENNNVDCTRLTKLRTALNIPTPNPVHGKFQEYFLNFAFPGKNGEKGPGSINGRQFKTPVVSALTQPEELTNQCTDKDCGEEKLCNCINSLTIRSGDLIQMTFLNMGEGRIDDHPVHMHGHAFMVIKVGYGVFNQSTGTLIRDSEDINCKGNTKMSMCNDATWKNSSWLNGNVPGIVQRGAPLKDTVIVPSGGYVVIRFPATVPGVWFLHCHIDMHANDGMAMVLNESFADIPKPPPGFPKCGNFYPDDIDNIRSDNTENTRLESLDINLDSDYKYIPLQNNREEDNKEYTQSNTGDDVYTKTMFWVMVSVLVAIIVVQFIIIVFAFSRLKQTSRQSTGQCNKAYES